MIVRIRYQDVENDPPPKLRAIFVRLCAVTPQGVGGFPYKCPFHCPCVEHAHGGEKENALLFCAKHTLPLLQFQIVGPYLFLGPNRGLFIGPSNVGYR